MAEIVISDPTLRDGNHAIQHQLSTNQIRAYCHAADGAGIPIVEVGHGNGLAASSLQLGQSLVSDREMLEVARDNLRTSKLGVFMIAGFATIKRDLKPALDIGADVVRVGSHCTEADTTQRHIAFAREMNKITQGCLMMSHMATPEQLLAESVKLESYGANGVILMDSAGAMLPRDVTERIGLLARSLSISVGFHAHNNLGFAVANSVAAVEAGARIIDGTSRGFGAGAGNAQLEVLVAVLRKLGYVTHIDLYKMLDLSDMAEAHVIDAIPFARPTSIVSGMAGVVSTMSKHVTRIAAQYDVDARDVFFELGQRKAVAGQEDLIIEVAAALAQTKSSRNRGFSGS